MKQSEVAAACGISPGHLSNIIHNKVSPSWKVAKRLAKLLSTDPSLWMGEDQFAKAMALFRAKYPQPRPEAENEGD